MTSKVTEPHTISSIWEYEPNSLNTFHTIFQCNMPQKREPLNIWKSWPSGEKESYSEWLCISCLVHTCRKDKSNWIPSCNLHLTFIKPWIVMYSFKYNQQDAKLYNILYYCQWSTCFGRFLRPSSGTQELYLLLPLAVAASKLGTYQMLCVQFLSSWWWAEKPPETCTALTVIKNIV